MHDRLSAKAKQPPLFFLVQRHLLSSLHRMHVQMPRLPPVENGANDVRRQQRQAQHF